MADKGREVPPEDSYNSELLENVRPPGWINPRPARLYDLVVVGAGTAGLVAAEEAARLGARVALVERRLIGGDCLNLGCVPSKTIISSSRVTEEIREAEGHGVRVICGAEADFAAVMERMRRLRARISRNDSAARLRGMGVDIFLGQGRFTGRHAAEVDGVVLRFRKALIATGARPFVPPTEGLAEAGYLTSDTVFNLTSRPARMAVLGGGAIGCEMAQAFQRLGTEVTILQKKVRLMDKEDPEASEVLQRVLTREGVRLVLGDWTLGKVERAGGGKAMHLEKGGEQMHIPVDEVLVAVGRTPNTDGLGLEAAGVEYDMRAGVLADAYLRTSNRDVFSAGDVSSRFRFSHTAAAAARMAVGNALMGGRARFDRLVVSWCTFTDPEIAHSGMYDFEAAGQGISVRTVSVHLDEVDRAVMEGEEDGFVKVHVQCGTDRILGATIVARHAGEMIAGLTLAISEGVGLRRLAEIVQPYPTRAEAVKKAAEKFVREGPPARKSPAGGAGPKR